MDHTTFTAMNGSPVPLSLLTCSRRDILSTGGDPLQQTPIRSLSALAVLAKLSLQQIHRMALTSAPANLAFGFAFDICPRSHRLDLAFHHNDNLVPSAAA